MVGVEGVKGEGGFGLFWDIGAVFAGGTHQIQSYK